MSSLYNSLSNVAGHHRFYLINTPFKFFVIIGMLFSLLLAFAAWGNTLLMLHEEEDKSYARREAIKSGVRVCIGLSIFAILLIIVFEHWPE